MANPPIGYEFLREKLATNAFALSRTAIIAPVSRVTDTGQLLQVPASVAPRQEDSPLAHLLFALKHEGLEMQAAILALKKIPATDVLDAFRSSPSSVYLRMTGYLWELAHRKELTCDTAAQGAYAALFDPDQFITSDIVQRNARWRINFNGLGNPWYCPTVRRSAALEALLEKDILTQVQTFIETLDPALLERAVSWAYLSETEGSFEIERETPSATKAEAFAKLLAQAHKPERITEEYLASLQQMAVTNPIDHAFEFRNKQNWLRGPLNGARGVTYVPPCVDDMMAIMSSIMAMANTATTSKVNPLIMGSLTSFAFVFAHPFMDGNGRLSRFLFHRVVGSSGALPDGVVLPVSVAMKRNEARYLAALESFSKPARTQWDVKWVDGDSFDLEFRGDTEIYRYWDATPCVEFGLDMAQEALDKDLREESEFLRRYDTVYKALNESIDMNGNDLAQLTRFATQNRGVLSKNRIKQFLAKGHSLHLLETAQAVINQALIDTDDLNGESASNEQAPAD